MKIFIFLPLIMIVILLLLDCKKYKHRVEQKTEEVTLISTFYKPEVDRTEWGYNLGFDGKFHYGPQRHYESPIYQTNFSCQHGGFTVNSQKIYTYCANIPSGTKMICYYSDDLVMEYSAKDSLESINLHDRDFLGIRNQDVTISKENKIIPNN